MKTQTITTKFAQLNYKVILKTKTKNKIINVL